MTKRANRTLRNQPRCEALFAGTTKTLPQADDTNLFGYFQRQIDLFNIPYMRIDSSNEARIVISYPGIDSFQESEVCVYTELPPGSYRCSCARLSVLGRDQLIIEP